jgi:hypothetical protein
LSHRQETLLHESLANETLLLPPLHLNTNICSSNSSTEPQKELTPAQIRAHLRTRPDSLDSANPHEQLLRVDVLAFCLSDAEPAQIESVSADSSTGSSDSAATAGDVPAFIRNRYHTRLLSVIICNPVTRLAGLSCPTKHSVDAKLSHCCSSRAVRRCAVVQFLKPSLQNSNVSNTVTLRVECCFVYCCTA